MKLWSNIKIHNMQHRILILIYRYRGLTNEHLRRILYSHLKSDIPGQKANISKFVSMLKKAKLIESSSCYPYSRELIHNLTKKGVEYVKENVIIDPKNSMAGFNDEICGDFDAKLLSPSTGYIEHTMLFLDFVTRNKQFPVRNNYYAVQNYTFNQQISSSSTIKKTASIKPDGEIMIGEKVWSLEVDTGHERFSSLLGKFTNYKKYLDYCFEENHKRAWNGIFIVTKQSELPFEKDIRLHTILRAACEGLQHYVYDFPVFIFNRKNEYSKYTLLGLLKEKTDVLRKVDISIPSKVNPLIEKRNREQQKLNKEKHREDEIHRSILEGLQKENPRLEQKRNQQVRERKLIEESQKEELEEVKRKNSRFWGLGRYFF
ncbi:replication-relaxation family protein [Cytobacillus dafuensis]|nr:replication-relaxation family protein [Cytobacillus dafuensis]